MAQQTPRDLWDVAAVWFPDGPFGSGRLIAPGLVLTAGHTLDYPSRAAPSVAGWRVRLLRQRGADGQWQGEPYEAECVWRGENIDLALLKIGTDCPEPAQPPSFAVPGKHEDAEAIGYPRATWDAAGKAREFRVCGSLRNETVDYPLALAVSMSDVPSDMKKWVGMSGAVVVGRDSSDRVRVFGAVGHVDEAFPYGKLYVERIAAAFDDPAFRQALASALGEEPELEYVAARPAREFAFSNTRFQERIYSTFRSTHQTLRGRGRELDQLAQLLFPGTPIKVVAVQAVGGMGKTALARECCVVREIWKSYDIIVGAQARKRQLLIEPMSPTRRTLRFEDRFGAILGTRQFIVEVATQLGLHCPDARTENDLEQQILRKLEGRRALFILDNLESMENIVEMLSLLDRICSPPTRKALITARQVPDDHSSALHALQLSSIREPEACRELVFDIMTGCFDSSTGHDRGEEVNTIVDVAKGHPLALQLLTSKLITQGRGPIRELRKKWDSHSADVLDDEFLATLCDYTFDSRFRAHVGDIGLALLSVIADEDGGITEDDLHGSTDLPRDKFDIALGRVFGAGCIYRGARDDGIVLLMHPITQAYFRARPESRSG